MSECLRRNFGRNRAWEAQCLRPASEDQVLEILEQSAGKTIRAVGAGHSWSAIAVSEVSLELSAFCAVALDEEPGGRLIVRAGAGCTLQALLDCIRGCGRTLPTLGAIKKQTVAGAVSTGTHGSGAPSLSQFVVGARLAAYGADGRPRIVEIGRGDPALEAVRCGLGCTGILLRVDLETVSRYDIEEEVLRFRSYRDAMRAMPEWPLTQFALFPYAWTCLLFKRRRRPGARSPCERLWAWLLRGYNTVWIDTVFHLAVKLSAGLGDCAARFFQKHAQCVAAPYRRADDSEPVLTLHHYYFRHEEMELFVPARHLRRALAVLRLATEMFAGNYVARVPSAAALLRRAQLHDSLENLCGRYTHHYPYSIRRVPPESGLLAMGSAHPSDKGGDWYSISVFTYLPPHARSGYYAFCAWLARAMHRLFGARLHWGKHFPLGAAEVAAMYPQAQRFRELCASYDPRGVFRNDFVRRLF